MHKLSYAGGCSAEENSNLTAVKVSVRESEPSGFKRRGMATLSKCSAVKCCHHGLFAMRDGTRVKAEGCSFQENRFCGSVAIDSSAVEMTSCSSSHDEGAGYCATGTNAKLSVMNSWSDGDARGYHVLCGGVLTMQEVTVDGVYQSGKLS